jgi:hypothetical protein
MTHIYLILPLVALGKKSEKTDGGRKRRLEGDNKFNYRKPGSIQKEDTSRPSIKEIQEAASF